MSATSLAHIPQFLISKAIVLRGMSASYSVPTVIAGILSTSSTKATTARTVVCSGDGMF